MTMKDNLGKQMGIELRAFLAASHDEQDKIAERIVALLLGHRDSVQRRKDSDFKHKYLKPRP